MELTWDYPTCFKKTETLVSNCLGRDSWNTSLKSWFVKYQNKRLLVPQRLLYVQWEFICRLRKTMNKTRQWAVNQCLHPTDYIVLNSFMFFPFRTHLYLFFVQEKQTDLQYVDLVKHMICSMNAMLIHLKERHFHDAHFQQNMIIWFTSFNIKRISLESHI